MNFHRKLVNKHEFQYSVLGKQDLVLDAVPVGHRDDAVGEAVHVRPERGQEERALSLPEPLRTYPP